MLENPNQRCALARIVLFALKSVDKNEVDIQQPRKAEMDFSNNRLFYIGAKARPKLKDWPVVEDISVNAIVVSLFDKFFAHLKKSTALRE